MRSRGGQGRQHKARSFVLVRLEVKVKSRMMLKFERPFDAICLSTNDYERGRKADHAIVLRKFGACPYPSVACLQSLLEPGSALISIRRSRRMDSVGSVMLVSWLRGSICCTIQGCFISRCAENYFEQFVKIIVRMREQVTILCWSSRSVVFRAA